MATATVTLALNQAAFLAGMARASSSVSSLGNRIGGTVGRGFAIAGTAAVAFATAAAIGIKNAFNLGGRLADMSAISGRSAKEILLLRRALEDAGISMEKIDRFILTGQDRGKVIARALENMTSGDWRDAAASVGKQADILDKNAKTFDRVSDLLGRSGDKLQGFFVGAAGSIGKALLPILERFDKMDFASQGEKFGAGLLQGAQALVGFFQKPELLFKAAGDYFKAAMLGVGNTLIAVFQSAILFFKNGMLEAMVGVGSALAATLLESFKKPLAQLQAGFEEIASGDAGRRVDIGIKTKARDVLGVNMSGELNSFGRALQSQIDRLEKEITVSFDARVEAILASGGPKLGFGEGKNAAEFRKQASDQATAAIGKLAGQVIGQFAIPDIFGAAKPLGDAQAATAQASRAGRNALPMEMAGRGGIRPDLSTARVPIGGLDESVFARRDAARAEEFESRWSGPKADAGLKTSKADALLQKLSEQAEAQTQITREAWATP